MSRPCDTPCDTFRVCRVGLKVASVAAKFGGGTASPEAIPIRLGAGASAAALVCLAGTFPPLTIKGAGSTVSSTSGFAGADVDFVGCSADAASSSSALWRLGTLFGVDSLIGALLGAAGDGLLPAGWALDFTGCEMGASVDI